MALLRPAAPQPRAWLVLEPAGASDDERGRGALAMAALVMSAAERQQLDDALTTLDERLELRANPLADDLADDAPDAQLRRLLPSALPKLTAAEALLATSWRGSAGGFVARAVVACPPARACVDPSARGGDAEARRARFLAWPLSSAARVQFADAAAAQRAAESLRRRAAAPDSRIALVIGGASPSPMELVALRAHAARVARRLRRAGAMSPLLARLLDAEWPSPPSWVTPAPNELVIIPRLGSLAALAPFAAELTTLVPDARAMQLPRPLD